MARHSSVPLLSLKFSHVVLCGLVGVNFYGFKECTKYCYLSRWLSFRAHLAFCTKVMPRWPRPSPDPEEPDARGGATGSAVPYVFCGHPYLQKGSRENLGWMFNKQWAPPPPLNPCSPPSWPTSDGRVGRRLSWKEAAHLPGPGPGQSPGELPCSVGKQALWLPGAARDAAAEMSSIIFTVEPLGFMRHNCQGPFWLGSFMATWLHFSCQPRTSIPSPQPSQVLWCATPIKSWRPLSGLFSLRFLPSP